MKLFEITDVAMPESENGKQQITPMQIPAFPEFPKQVGDLGNGASASQTKNGGTKLSSGQGTFVWDKAGQPSKWQAPTFGGMSQLYDIRTGDITARYKSGGLDVTMVYDKTGKAKQDSGSASYNMGIAKASTGPQGNSITVQGGSPEQDQTVKMGETATAGATSSGAVATVANPPAARQKIKLGKNGTPEAPQKKNKDGTAKNALELSNNLMGGSTIKR